MLVTMKNIVGGGDSWAANPDGSVQVKTTSSGTSQTVTFTNVPTAYGYALWKDCPSGCDPTMYIGEPEITNVADGTCTVTYAIAGNVSSTQAENITYRLRLVK